MKKFTKRSFSISPTKFKKGSPNPKSDATPSPPPPPPLKFDVIIAQVYGPTANIYKDIFEVSPTASQQELKRAYLNKRNQTQAKLDKLSNRRNNILKPKVAKQTKKHLLMQMNAISEANQIVTSVQRKKEYDKSIGVKAQIPQPDISFDLNGGEFLGDELKNNNGAIEITSANHIDLSSRMKEYLKEKQSDERRSMCSDDYDVISTKEDTIKKVQFTLESLGAPSPEDVKRAPIVSPTGADGFDDVITDFMDSSDPDDKISPIARVRQNKEKNLTMTDVVASYLNINNFIGVKKCDNDDDRTNHTDSYTVEDDWSSEGTVKVSHCKGDMGIFDFTEDVLARASNIADGLCQ